MNLADDQLHEEVETAACIFAVLPQHRTDMRLVSRLAMGFLSPITVHITKMHGNS